MIDFLALMVKMGRITLGQVPERWRAGVSQLLAEHEATLVTTEELLWDLCLF